MWWPRRRYSKSVTWPTQCLTHRSTCYVGPAFASFHIFQSRVFHHCSLNGSVFTIPAFFAPPTSTCKMAGFTDSCSRAIVCRTIIRRIVSRNYNYSRGQLFIRTMDWASAAAQRSPSTTISALVVELLSPSTLVCRRRVTRMKGGIAALPNCCHATVQMFGNSSRRSKRNKQRTTFQSNSLSPVSSMHKAARNIETLHSTFRVSWNATNKLTLSIISK